MYSIIFTYKYILDPLTNFPDDTTKIRETWGISTDWADTISTWAKIFTNIIPLISPIKNSIYSLTPILIYSIDNGLSLLSKTGNKAFDLFMIDNLFVNLTAGIVSIGYFIDIVDILFSWISEIWVSIVGVTPPTYPSTSDIIPKFGVTSTDPSTSDIVPNTSDLAMNKYKAAVPTWWGWVVIMSISSFCLNIIYFLLNFRLLYLSSNVFNIKALSWLVSLDNIFNTYIYYIYAIILTSKLLIKINNIFIGILVGILISASVITVSVLYYSN